MCKQGKGIDLKDKPCDMKGWGSKGREHVLQVGLLAKVGLEAFKVNDGGRALDFLLT